MLITRTLLLVEWKVYASYKNQFLENKLWNTGRNKAKTYWGLLKAQGGLIKTLILGINERMTETIKK